MKHLLPTLLALIFLFCSSCKRPEEEITKQKQTTATKYDRFKIYPIRVDGTREEIGYIIIDTVTRNEYLSVYKSSIIEINQIKLQ